MCSSIMASFNYYLKNNKDQGKEITLYLYVTISREQRVILNTGLKVAPKYWNFKQKCLRSSAKGAPEKNAELQKLKAKIELAYLKNLALNISELKLKLQNEISPVLGRNKGVPMLSEAIQWFMEDMEGVLAKNYLRSYHQVLNYILGRKNRNSSLNKEVAMQRDVRLDKVGAPYLEQYKKWMVGDGYQNESIRKHQMLIKKVLNVNSALFKLDSSRVNVRNIKLKRKKPFWLDHEEVRLIIGYDFKNKRKEQVADEWLFRYYTGLRDQDSQQIQKHHVKRRGDYFYLDFNMIKNGRDFLLPLSDAAVQLLEKYEYNLPKYSNQEKNRMIKLCFEEVGLDKLVEKVKNVGSTRSVELVPKWKLVTTHSARRSFGRRWMDTVGDIEALSQYLGQSSSAITRDYLGWELEEYESFVKQLDFS